MEKAFKKVFPHKRIIVKGLESDLGVGDQPMGNEETLMRAIDRSRFCRNEESKADFWVGIVNRRLLPNIKISSDVTYKIL